MAEEVTIESLQAQVEGLEKELAAEKAKTVRANKRLKVERAAKSPEARKLGAMKPAKGEEDAADRAAALEAAFAGDVTEIVFSDGKKEIRELAPLKVGGDAWRVTPQGRVLNDEPLLEPGDCQRESMELRGFALLDAEGEQVAYHALPTAITIERNRRYQLALNSIRF